jgi:hypothetical protein
MILVTLLLIGILAFSDSKWIMRCNRSSFRETRFKDKTPYKDIATELDELYGALKEVV